MTERNLLNQFVDQLMNAVAHEEPVIAVLGEDRIAVLAVIDECIKLLSDHTIRIIRLRGLPGSPLTLSRIVQELGVVKQSGVPIDDDELIVRVLANPSEPQDRVLLIIEQAELLPSRTLAFLQIISTVFNTAAPRLQILFSGHLTFKQLIEKSDLAGAHGRLGTTVQITTAPIRIMPNTPPPSHSGASKMHDETSNVPSRGRYKTTSLVILLSAILSVGIIFTLFKTDPTEIAESGEKMPYSPGAGRADPTTADITGRAPLQLSKPELSRPSTPSLQSVAPLPSLTPPAQSSDRDPDLPTAAQPVRRQGRPSSEQLVLLRKEFEQFLAQTEWGSKRQSDSERSRLFDEFVQWNYGASSSGPELLPQVAAAPLLSRARVTLHFLTGSTSGKGLALQLASTLRPSVALARTRSVTDVPKTFEVRYFAQEDELLAGALAQMLQAPDATWIMRIMPDARPTPVPHTVELWIPLR